MSLLHTLSRKVRVSIPYHRQPLQLPEGVHYIRIFCPTVHYYLWWPRARQFKRRLKGERKLDIVKLRPESLILLLVLLTPKPADVSEHLSDLKGVDLRDLLQRVCFLGYFHRQPCIGAHDSCYLVVNLRNTGSRARSPVKGRARHVAFLPTSELGHYAIDIK